MKTDPKADALALCCAAKRRTFIANTVQVTAYCAIAVVVVYSAMVAKRMASGSRLAALAAVQSIEPEIEATADGIELHEPILDPLVALASTVESEAASLPVESPAAAPAAAYPASTRWFNGRPVRPARTITMTVTAYTADEISCGDSADGITASLHHVDTNGGFLVAADSRLLPLGSMVSVPGYDAGRVVPVLDRGGKIKGNRLDLLMKTNEQARAWGVKRVKVVVWEYADGKPADNWRKIRDSK